MASTIQKQSNKIKMDLSEKDWVTYQRFTWAKGKHAQLRQWLLLSFVFLILPMFAISNIIYASSDPQRNPWAGSFMILILFVYLLYKWLIGYPLKYRQTPELFHSKQTYEFAENSFKVIKKSPAFNSETTLEYRDLKKVYETKTCFYFVLGKGLALILRKEVIKDLKELKMKLLNTLEDKFVDCQ